MFGKLVRYEWKQTRSIGFLLIGIVAGVALLGTLFFLSPLWQELFSGYQSSKLSFAALSGVLGVGSIVTFILVLVGTMYAMLIYLGVHFYRTMFSVEGYLYHTLPVNASELLWSRILTGWLWMLLLEIMMLVTSVIIAAAFLCGFIQTRVEGLNSLQILLDAVVEGGRKLGETYYEMSGISPMIYVYMLIVSLFIGPFMSLGTLYGALSVGQLSGRYKGILGVLIYFGVLFITAVLGNGISGFIMNFAADELQKAKYMLLVFMPVPMLLMMITGIGGILLTIHIMDHKLNLI